MFETSNLAGNSNLTVVLNAAYVNGGGVQCTLVGSESEPLTFRAQDDNPAYGVQFGTANDTYFGHYSGGNTYVKLHSGTYSTGNGRKLFVGAQSRTGNGHLTIETSASMDVGTDCEFSYSSDIVNRGLLKIQRMTYKNGSETSTFTFDGGTIEAKAAATLITDNSYVAVNVTSNGGTIDAAGYAVSIERPIADASGESGAMTFKGGGSVALTAAPTYTGMTTIEIGTRLAVPSPIAGNKLAFTIPAGLANGVYPIIAITGEGVFADDVLSAITVPVDENATYRLSGDKKTIVCLYGFDADGDVYIGATDGDLSTASNWLSGAVPTSGAPTIFCGSAATLSVGATFASDTVIVPANSAVVTIGAGALHVNTLTNASKLAIGAGASLEVDRDIVARQSSWRGTVYFLYSNEGSVIVHGNAVGMADDTGTVYEYVTGNANTKPMQVGGIRYDSGGRTLYFHINSYNNQEHGSWVVGGNGIGFTSGREHSVTKLYAEHGGSVMFHSSADWTLANSMKNSANEGEIMMSSNGGAITFDTSDYNDQTVPRTITLQGRLYANNVGMGHSAFIIDGCGTVVVDTADMSSVTGIADPLKHTCITNSILQVRSGATLQVNAGKKITGANGRIALDAGATLALVSGGTDDFTSRIEPAVTLPTEGVATIRIDGARLSSGDHTILSNVTAGTTSNVTLDPASTALGGRKGSLRIDGSNLVLTNEPSGTIMMVY